MSTTERARLPLLSEIPQGCSLQKSEAGERFTCVRVGDQIHVLADRCPHQGYPLSQGDVRDGVLTCAWHNWKFEVETGDCQFGGEAVRRFPSVIEDGRVVVDRSVDPHVERARLTASLQRALVQVDAGAVVREGLRLGALEREPSLDPAFALLAELGARRAPYGFDHPLATLADLHTWVERGWLPGPEALSVAATLLAEDHANLGERPVPPMVDEWSGMADDLREERRQLAESRARAAARAGAIDRLLAEEALPYLGDHLLSYGHGAIYTDKAATLARAFPDAAEDLLAALAVRFGWGTRETSLPPWRATRSAFDEGDAITPGTEPLPDRGGFEAAVLTGEAAAVEATLEQLRAGVAPVELLRAIGHAAAHRLARFDARWETRPDAEVGALDVTHTLTFADAVLALLPRASARDAVRLTIQAAAFVGKVHRGDRDAEPEPAPTGEVASLADAIAQRRGELAGPIARALSPAQRLAAYAELAPFAAYDTFVRPIFIAHAIKVTEAAHRLERADPAPDHAYLEATLAFLLPRRPERAPVRAATLARLVTEEGRPPKGLY